MEHPYLAAQGTSGKAIYPTFSFLSHSCMANARLDFTFLAQFLALSLSRYSVDPENKMTIRASWGIKKGEEITIQYISFLFGNSRRREDIKSCWFFECGCPRCSSISELGIYQVSLSVPCSHVSMMFRNKSKRRPLSEAWLSGPGVTRGPGPQL